MLNLINFSFVIFGKGSPKYIFESSSVVAEAVNVLGIIFRRMSDKVILEGFPDFQTYATATIFKHIVTLIFGLI